MINRKKLVNEILKNTNEEFSDEELIHMLLEQKVTANINEKGIDIITTGQKAADSVAKFVGSWTFIFSFLLVMAIWMAINVIMLSNAFDPYPFILLNLLLSCIAAIQAPLIMMSQNRQEEKDRDHANNDYKVNLKNELVIDVLYSKVDLILKNQNEIMKALDLKQTAKSDKQQTIISK